MKPNVFRSWGVMLCAVGAGLVLASCGKSGTSGEDRDAHDRKASGPAGRVEHETVVKSGPFELKAVLVVPARDAGQLVPGAVIVPSFDPVDRDGRFVSAGFGFEPYKDLADELARGGVATIRYDKRIIQPYAKQVNVAEFTLETYYDDVRAALDVLHNTEGVDAKRLFFIGHGEGAVIVTAMLEADPGLGIRGLVLIAPPMLPYDDLIIRQHTMGMRQRELEVLHNPATESFHKPIIERMRQGLTTYATAFGALKEGQGGWPEEYALNGFCEPFWRHAIKLYAGTPDRIMGLKLPIYIFQGNRYLLVLAQDLLRRERELWATGHVKITLWDAVGHYLIEEDVAPIEPAAGTGPQPDELEIKRISPGAAAAIAAWIKNPVIPPAPDHTELESDKPLPGSD